MPKQGQRAEVNSFVKGLITEASPLNFPANASKNEENFELNRNGTRDRRFGMSYEENFVLQSLPGTFTTDSGISTFKWGAVNGLSDKEFLVVQFGQVLSFFDSTEPNLSSSGFVGTVTLSDLPSTVNYSFTALQGSLVVVAGIDVVKVVSYSSVTGAFSVGTQRLTVRDVWGIEVVGSQYETDTSFRDGAIYNHTYNLHNQSWGVPRKGPSDSEDPIFIYVDSNNDFLYPSNSEVVWTGLQFQAGVEGAAPFERIYSNLYKERRAATNLASKGYFVIDLLRRGQSRSIAVQNNQTKYPTLNPIFPTFPADFTPGGASVVAEFAGRVFYSGFSGEVIEADARSPNLSNFVLFSKLINNIPDIGVCYQEGDPTSRDSSDLIDTDGGFIRISGAKNIISIENMETHLIIIADNGVWAISGGNEFGFSATNYKVAKISSYGSKSKASIVKEGGRKFFWADDGIYVIAKNQYGDLEVSSITQTTIQTLYNNISTTGKQNAIGIYDPTNKKLRWTYKDVDDLTDKELIFDLTLNSFYQHRIMRIENSSPTIVGVFTSTSFGQTAINSFVLSDVDDVLSDTDPVVIPSTSRAAGIQSVKYLTLVPVGSGFSYTFSSYIDSQFIDWKDFNTVGADAFAFMETGEMIAGDSAIPKQVPYLVMHFLRTENGVSAGLPTNPSSCLIRSMWDWSNTINSNKWSNLFQAYRYRKAFIPLDEFDTFDNGFQIVKTKNKLRGRGNAFSLHMETEPLKDCRILGWALTVNANTIT